MHRQYATAQRIEQRKKLQLQQQQEKHYRHCIKSPAGWIVEERYVDPGQWLDMGNPVVKVGNYAKLLVPFALSVKELNALQAMQKNLSVWLPEYDQQIPATIERISPAFDTQSRKIQVDLLLEKNLPVHRGGLRVILKLKIPDSTDIFLISAKALNNRFEENWLSPKEGQPHRVKLLGIVEKGVVRIKSKELKTGKQYKLFQP
jgi:hypothetical protein